MQIPTLAVERSLFADGYHWIAGIDEVGRGAWAGPVVAAAVILPVQEQTLIADLAGVRDSKLLTPAQRHSLAQRIRAQALTVGTGMVSHSEIDAHGIVAATRRAMLLALAALPFQPDYLVIDALTLPGCPIAQMAIIHGDARCLSVAAASIIAKVTRDNWMVGQDSAYPGYGFAQHKGYGTRAHQSALARLGPTTIHRRSFAPLRHYLSAQGEHCDTSSDASLISGGRE